MIEQFDWNSLETKTFKTKSGSTVYATGHSPELIDLYEQSFANLRTSPPSNGEKITGQVISKNDRYAAVNINWREPAYIDLSKENPKYIKYIQEGYEVDVVINEGNKNGFTYTASYSNLITEKLKQDIFDNIGKPTAYLAKVKELIFGGYFLDIEGVEVFMPGSVAGMNKLTEFESLIGETIYVCAINYSKEKNYIVVSHREFLKSQVPAEAAKLTVGENLTGQITGTSKFGVFVEFNNCLTGLIHKTDLDEATLAKFNDRSLKAGESINFKPKEVVDEFRIVLTQKEIKEFTSIWDTIDTLYQVPCNVNGKIKSIANFGVFIEIEPKISGLLHKSEIEDITTLKEGDRVNVKLYKIDKEAKKLFFKF